jgi:hypothetical protein
MDEDTKSILKDLDPTQFPADLKEYSWEDPEVKVTEESILLFPDPEIREWTLLLLGKILQDTTAKE